MGIEEHLGYNVLTTTLEKLVDWGRKSSLWPATFGLACCAIEMICTAANRYDIARFGMEGQSPPGRPDHHRRHGVQEDDAGHPAGL
jgi:NADH:ubiquinone oxidoreductase subunit B-like Fe-S oxidoreductase